MPVVLIVLICVVAFFIIALVAISVALACKVSLAKRYSTLESKKIEKNRDCYRDYDDYDKEDFTVKSYDGYILNGTFVKAVKESKKYVIISHGYTYTRFGSLKYLFIFRKLGYNVIIYDDRDFGENKKTYCTMGLRESKDLIAVINYAYKTFGEDIYLGLHGESMGAALSVIALKYKPKVKFLVSDCGYGELFSVLVGQVKQILHLPPFFVKIASLFNKILFRYRFEDVNPIDSLAGNSVPILYMHGKDDKMSDVKQSENMYNATSSYSEFHVFSDARHAESYLKHPIEYEKITADFIRKIEKKDGVE